MATKEVDPLSGTETTGHEWDGIKELNTPLPKWWLYVFYMCIIWAAVYCVLFPSWPWLSGYAKGVLGHTNRAQFNEQMAALEKERSVWSDKIAATPVAAILDDPDLTAIATAGGRVVFNNNCAPCHGTGGVGRPGGFPALVDDDWIWGGTIDAIYTTVQHGIRNASDPDARISQMPVFGDILNRDQINAVADHVLFLSGHGPDNAEGATVFAENCAVCHGELGKGNRELGAPNLTDQISLYGESKAAVVAQITNPRQGVMPAWQGRLTDSEIKQAAIFVHSLGGGE